MPLRRLLFELSRCVAAAVTAESGQKSGDGRARTGDPLLAKQVLSQLSYAPKPVLGDPRGAAGVGLSGFEPETSRLSAVRSHQLS